MVDYNIEFSHIYADEEFGTEHRKSVKILLEFIEELKSQNKTFVTTVMIDDYNPDKKTLSTTSLIQTIASLGVTIDFVIYESQLISSAHEMLDEMSGKIKNDYQRYIADKGKYPCSFLLAIWHLSRLGFPPSLNSSYKEFYGKESITILPQKFYDVEKMARKIIKSTKYANQIKRIQYKFF